ncbi:MAG TPA: hypothetical protein VK175_14820 [Leadbetterella sp.]|nr:hypothetical protein [Leadbetterella sp.]
MLPIELTREPKFFANDEFWEEFINQIGKYAKIIDKDFLSQICYEHAHRFNYQFPKFDINKNQIIRVHKTAQEILNEIKYESGQELTFHFDNVNNYLLNPQNEINHDVLKYILDKGTWSFPPVIIKYNLALKLGCKKAGCPIYLIEGTHRVSYIIRLVEVGIISKDSKHEFLEII